MSAPAIPRVSPELARSAREHFQPLYVQRLSDDDGLDIATNVLGAFGVLREMKRNRDAERLAAAVAGASVAPPSEPGPPAAAVIPTRRRPVRPTSVNTRSNPE